MRCAHVARVPSNQDEILARVGNRTIQCSFFGHVGWITVMDTPRDLIRRFDDGLCWIDAGCSRRAQAKGCSSDRQHQIAAVSFEINHHGFLQIKEYPVHVRTRKSFGLMTRTLSVTESRKLPQFLGTLSREKSSGASANCRRVA